MDCKQARELLPAHVDKELAVTEGAVLAHHLDGCAECQRQLTEQTALVSIVKGQANYFLAPGGLAGRITAALPHKASAPRRAAMLRGWAWWKAGVGIAFAALIASNIVLYRALPNADEQLAHAAIASHVRALMGSRPTDVVSADQHTVKPWFNGKLDFSPPVTDLAAQGFPLTGGRLDYLDNRPVAALVYQHRRHIIDLYVWPAANDGDSSVRTLSHQGYNLMHWRRSGMTFWAVSDLAGQELGQFARLLSEASTRNLGS
jgi:anti-sigma factor RsiW